MLAAVDWPVVAPSANPSGVASPRNAKDVLEALDGRLDLLIDSGPTRYGEDSTIVAVEGDSWHMVRQGVYSERELARLACRTILFVCTGNTCRSPTAAGLARKMLGERLGCPPGKLTSCGWEVLSAGVWAGEDQRATPQALEVAREFGVDLAAHRSQKLTKELIDKADMVFCMTREHVDAARELSPASAGRVRRLWSKGDILDPAGGGPDVYRRTARKMQQAIEEILRKELHENRPRR
jgi:protein-tyrosine phosphatase